jgi:hypothetical protein
MNSKRIYYSCSSRLSYDICQRFYDQKHYAWCAPYFDAFSRFSQHNSVPPSSSPRTIYWNLHRDVNAIDLHSTKIKDIRRGIQRGAAVKLKEGSIDAMEYREILKIVMRSQLADFTPLMFVIPLQPIAHLCEPVGVGRRAHPLSEEYIIQNLRREFFDAVEL